MRATTSRARNPRAGRALRPGAGLVRAAQPPIRRRSLHVNSRAEEMIPTGQDSLQTRSTLAVEVRTFAYYSLPKAAEALGDISRLPFSMKVLLENLLRFEDGETVTRDDLQAMVDWQKERQIAREIQYRPGARADAGFHRRSGGGRSRRDARCDERARRRPAEDQSAGAGPPRHRSQRDGRRIRQPHARSARTSSWNISATASATSSSNGAAQAFDNFQVVPPGTGICHQVNLEYVAPMRVDRRGPDRRDGRLSGHARRHRQPHDHGQRPRRARLGRRRDRGRGGDARPAGQHADPRSRRLPPGRRAQGRHHRHRPRADRHPDARARRASSAASSNFSGRASTA